MTFYATSRRCLRQYQLRYFGETGIPDYCGNCSICLHEERETVWEPSLKTPVSRRPAAKRPAADDLELDEALFQRLRQLRLTLARSAGIPPYAVFTDATLRDMCIYKPQTEKELLSIPGIGERKLQRYGALFLREIKGKKG